MGAAPKEAVIRFLKCRYARAIGCGDDQTATRLRTELDRLMNGGAATTDPTTNPRTDPRTDPATASELPPAA